MLWSKNKRRDILNRRKHRSFKKKFLLVIPVFIILASFFVFNSAYFKVQNLSVHKTYIDCATDQQLQENMHIKGSNIFFVDTNAVSNILQSKFKCIKKTSVTKKYPNTLHINVSGRVPVLRIATLHDTDATTSASLEEVIQEIASPSAVSSESATLTTNVLTNDFVIDQDGEIFAHWSVEDLPKILYLSTEETGIGKKLAKSLVESLLVLFDKLKVFNVDFAQVKVYSGGNILVDGHTTIVLNQKYDLQKQLASLQLILEKAKIGDEEILFLDLRFEKPVVRYVKKGRKD